MGKFRKKPIIIEAFCFTEMNIEQIAVWCNGQVKGLRLPKELWCIDIQTLEGEIRVQMGDWIIKNIEGKFFICGPSVFEMTYEKVE